jgi:hypothetical protein
MFPRSLKKEIPQAKAGELLELSERRRGRVVVPAYDGAALESKYLN